MRINNIPKINEALARAGVALTQPADDGWRAPKVPS